MATRDDRLMLAYPRWHRRLHGPDMLTALEDCAAAGRPVSARRLVLDGIACRMRVHGIGSLVIAACLSFIAAVALGAAVSWAIWQVPAKPWASAEEAKALAGPMEPRGMPPKEVIRRDQVLVNWNDEFDTVGAALLGTAEIGEGGVRLTYDTAPDGGRERALERAEADAKSQGWQVVRHGPNDLIAYRDGYRVRLLVFDGYTTILVSPAAPTFAYVFGWIGFAAGALLGWLAAAAAIARYRRLRFAGWFALLGGFFGVCLPMPASLLNLVALAMGADAVDGAPPWIGYEMFGARPGAILGAFGLCAAWLATILVEPEEVSAAPAR